MFMLDKRHNYDDSTINNIISTSETVMIFTFIYRISRTVSFLHCVFLVIMLYFDTIKCNIIRCNIRLCMVYIVIMAIYDIINACFNLMMS